MSGRALAEAAERYVGASFRPGGRDPMTGFDCLGLVLLFEPGPAQLHLGIAGIDGELVHAHAGLRRVVRTPFPLPWPVVRQWRLA